MKNQKRLPKFKNIEEESEYWDNHSTTDFDSVEITDDFIRNLKKSNIPKKKVTIRLDIELIDSLKRAAKKHGVPYQRFMRELIQSCVKRIS